MAEEIVYRVMITYREHTRRAPVSFSTTTDEFAWEQFNAAVKDAARDTVGIVVSRPPQEQQPPPPSPRAVTAAAPFRPGVPTPYDEDHTFVAPAPAPSQQQQQRRRERSLNPGSPPINRDHLTRIDTLKKQIASIDAGADNDPSGFERQSSVNLLIETLEEYLHENDFTGHEDLHARWSEAADILRREKAESKNPRT
jgi:hypothetical protein